jgi:hypothetical protein
MPGSCELSFKVDLKDLKAAALKWIYLCCYLFEGKGKLFPTERSRIKKDEFSMILLIGGA